MQLENKKSYFFQGKIILHLYYLKALLNLGLFLSFNLIKEIKLNFRFQKLASTLKKKLIPF
jgi:hypothetical protein